MFQGRAGKLPYKFIIPVPFLSNPQGFFLGALFDQLSTLHILLSRAPKSGKDTRVSSFARVNARGSFLALVKIHLPFLVLSIKESKVSFPFNKYEKEKGGENT
jgi:hypothetical protein